MSNRQHRLITAAFGDAYRAALAFVSASREVPADTVHSSDEFAFEVLTETLETLKHRPGFAANVARSFGPKAAHTCFHCGATVPYCGRGRRPRWCSPLCRQRGYRNRKQHNADNGRNGK